MAPAVVRVAEGPGDLRRNRSAAHQVEGRGRAAHAQHIAQRAHGSAVERAPIDHRRIRSRAGVALTTRSSSHSVRIDQRSSVRRSIGSTPGRGPGVALTTRSTRRTAHRSAVERAPIDRRRTRSRACAWRRPQHQSEGLRTSTLANAGAESAEVRKVSIHAA